MNPLDVFDRSFLFAAGASLLVGLTASGIIALVQACTPVQLDTVRDASEARAQLCTAVDVVSRVAPATAPDLEKARLACARGDDAEAIARALGRCDAPAEAGKNAVTLAGAGAAGAPTR